MDKLNIAEFREFGYLQEANRAFFHPLGLGLAIAINENGEEELYCVYDGRQDIEGFVYGEDTLDPDKAERVRVEMDQRKDKRIEKFGWLIQPVLKTSIE